MGFIKKICLLGDPAVGKTSIMNRYVHNKFSDSYLSTIGTKPLVKEIDHNGTEVTLTVWDIAGQESFQNVHSSYFKGAAGAILVCDITRRPTIENLAHWYHRFSSAARGAPVIVVSNKWDLVKDDSDMTSREGEIKTFIDLEDCLYSRASAKENLNVEKVFGQLLDVIMK